MKPPRWIVPLQPGQDGPDAPAMIVEVEIDLSLPDPIRVHFWQRGGPYDALPAVSPLVACHLGQALQDASAWCGQERARREARKR